MRVGVIGYGPFGQFLTQLLLDSSEGGPVHVANRLDEEYARVLDEDRGSDPRRQFHRLEDMQAFARGVSVVILAVSISSLEAVLGGCPAEVFEGRLVVDVCSVKMHPRALLLRLLPASADILCTHPMFGSRSASGLQGLQGKNFMFDRVRITDQMRCDCFLDVWRSHGCVMKEMPCEAHDEYAARSQFITHFVARSLQCYSLQDTPVDTPSYRDLCGLTAGLCADSLDLFAALYCLNPYAAGELRRLKEAIDSVELQLTSRAAAAPPPLPK